MNRNAKNVLYKFTDPENQKIMYASILKVFSGDETIKEYLNKNYDTLVSHHAAYIERDLYMSDPLLSVNDQVRGFSKEFIRDVINDITASFDIPVSYEVNDGIPTSRSQTRPVNADKILDSWAYNMRPGLTLRDDYLGSASIMDRNAINCGTYDSANRSARSQYMELDRTAPRRAEPNCRGVKERNTYYGQGERYVGVADNNEIVKVWGKEGMVSGTMVARNPYSGINFCDQSNFGTSQHVNTLLDNSYIQALNKTNAADMYQNQGFGNADLESDTRLLQRRIFRGEGNGKYTSGGIENGIPDYEKRLYRRNLDRDIGETMSVERDGMLTGYDMQSLRCRVNSKQQSRYNPDKNYTNLGFSFGAEGGEW